MAKLRKREIIIDPRFPVPPGVIDVRHQNEADASAYYYSEGQEGSGEGDLVAVELPTLESPQSQIPNAPLTYTIVSQTVKQAEDGTTTVDVVIEFPETNIFDVEVAYSKV